MTEYPLVPARLRRDGFGLEITCPGCGDTHHHGWGLGHRVAHCPACDGYVLVAATDTVAAANTDALRRHAQLEPELIP